MQEFINKIKAQLSEHIIFVGATILSAGVHFIFSIYIKAYVEPFEFGIYSTCALLQTYMAYLQLGSLNAFNRDYPQLIGAGNLEEAKRYRDTVLSFLLTVYSVTLVVTIAGISVVGKLKSLDKRLTLGFVLSAILTTVTTIENYGAFRLRIDKGFKFSSIAVMLELMSIPLGIILVPRIGYYAIYITSIIAMMIGILFYFKPSYCDFSFLWDKKLIKMILVSGMPLLINGLIWTVVNSIDKFVILGFINTEALGVYGIAQTAFAYMVLIPTAMSQLFYTKMGKEYGKTQDVTVLTNVSMNFSSILAVVTSLIALVAYFFLPILVNSFMPSYSSGVPSAQILILGLSVYATTLINGNILTILKRNIALLISSVCMCVFNAVCSIFYVYFLGAKIESVALGTATAYIFYTLVIVYQIHKYAQCEVMRVVTATILPVCISLIPGIFTYNYFSNRIIGFITATVFVVLFYSAFYRKQIKLIGGIYENLFSGKADI